MAKHEDLLGMFPSIFHAHLHQNTIPNFSYEYNSHKLCDFAFSPSHFASFSFNSIIIINDQNILSHVICYKLEYDKMFFLPFKFLTKHRCYLNGKKNCPIIQNHILMMYANVLNQVIGFDFNNKIRE